jgi:hypothetical protein
MAAGGAVLAAAVLLWNVAQRSVAFHEPAPPPVPEAPEAWLRAAAPTAALPLGTPTPAPSEQTTPAPYATPGLEEFAAQRGVATGLAPPVSLVAAPANSATRPAATPPSAGLGVKPVVYGAGVPARSVVLVARKGATLVISDAKGRVVFGRFLSAGDSWRGGVAPGFTVDVSDPGAFDVYAYGNFKGQLAQPITTLQQIAS